jgi:putative FmdB family regulatory protein
MLKSHGSHVLHRIRAITSSESGHDRRAGKCLILLMPIYVYELCEGDCKACGGCFEINRPVNREPLTKCPLCRKDVRKVITSVHTPKLLKPLSVSDAKNAGFSVWKKVGKGEYERE